MVGVLKCPQHHTMVKVARSLWLCDLCSYATGDMASLKGAVDEAFALLKAAGGSRGILEKSRERNRELRKKNRERRREEKEKYGEFGFYEAIRYSPDDGAARSADRGAEGADREGIC